MFQNLIGISDRREKLSVTGFADTSRQLFTTSGYDSPDKIMQLLHEVKEELAVERENPWPEPTARKNFEELTGCIPTKKRISSLK